MSHESITNTDDPIEQLRTLAATGVRPNAHDLLPAHADLVAALTKAHGSLSAARRTAGVSRGRAHETRESVLDGIRHLSAVGVRLSAWDLRTLGEETLLKAAFRFFGSWTNARRAAGIKRPRRRQVSLSRDEVLSELHRRASTDGFLSVRDLPGTITRAAREHFGTTSRGVAAAGLALRLPNQRWTRDSLLEELVRRRRTGKPISVAALRADRRDDVVLAIYRHIGNIEEALRLTDERAVSRAKNSPRARSRQLQLVTAALQVRLGNLVRDLVDRIVEATMRSLGLSFRTIAARFAPTEDATIVPTPDPDQLASVFSEVIATSGVSHRVAEVLAAALRGVPRKYLATALGITEDTVKTHVRQLIRRTGYADLDALLWSIHGRVAISGANGSLSRQRKR